MNTLSLSRRGVSFGALVAIVAATLLSLTAVTASPVHAGHQSSAGDAKGFTGGWFDGQTVEFFYNKNFFCADDSGTLSGADSNCALAVEPERAARPGNIPVLYVMTPLGFRPDESSLQCPVVGQCINHPSTIDVSRVFGAGTENFALPAHSHIVEVDQGGWWELEVIGVTDPAVWDEIVAAKSLERVRELQADGVGITGDIPTNAFLFFEVLAD